MSENNCRNCKYFDGFDGVGELWTDCSLLGGFKDSRTNCEHFEKKVTRYDLLNRINELEKENEHLVIGNKNLMKKNEELRKNRKNLAEECSALFQQNGRLKKENEQLRKENNIFRIRILDIRRICNFVIENNKRLSKQYLLDIKRLTKHLDKCYLEEGAYE